MIRFDSYNEFVTFYFSKLALVLQLLIFGFGIGSCITRFRYEVVWITVLGCLFDSFVSSIVAYIIQFIKSSSNDVFYYFVFFFILMCYTGCRLAMVFHSYETTKNSHNFFCIIGGITQLALNIPLIVLVVWIIVLIISWLWSALIWRLKSIIL
jgi:hypothetical protein